MCVLKQKCIVVYVQDIYIIFFICFASTALFVIALFIRKSVFEKKNIYLLQVNPKECLGEGGRVKGKAKTQSVGKN